MSQLTVPMHMKEIEYKINEKLKLVPPPSSELFETQQLYHDEVLEIYQEACNSLIDCSITYSSILNRVKNAYNNALLIRDKRIAQYITQDKVFGISACKKQRDEKIKNSQKKIEELKELNLKLTLEMNKLKKDMGKLKDDQFSDYLALMRERDARYTLYFENLGLQMKLKQLDGSGYPEDEVGAGGDPAVLRIALDRCREQLSSCQTELMRKTEEYAETVPRRQHEVLEARQGELAASAAALGAELLAARDTHRRLAGQNTSLEEELFECKERCRELERAGTPRPHWEICADFISGGRDRWWQLASGRSSRDILRVLLKELGPAAENENLEHFDGLGTEPSIPPYLRHCGKVRNLRLSRREVCVIINDIWSGKEQHPDTSMQDYVTKYFEDRYQQPSMRAEWAYNMCAGAEQALDEPQVRLFWGALHGHLSEDIYWALRRQWRDLRLALYKQSKDNETVTIEEFEKTARALFPLKSDVDVRSLSDVARKQLKLRLNNNELNLDKLFHESEEGFGRAELARELHRQRRRAQDLYLREVAAALAAGGRRRRAERLVSAAALRRALAILDPAIDHIRMERYVRWVFGEQAAAGAQPGQAADPEAEPSLPLSTVMARLAAADFERAGPRYRPTRRSYKS